MQVIASNPHMFGALSNLTLLGTAVRNVDNGSYVTTTIGTASDITIPTGTGSCLAIVCCETAGGTGGERFPLSTVRFGFSGTNMTEWFTTTTGVSQKTGVYYYSGGMGSGTIGGTTNSFNINPIGGTETLQYFRVFLFFFEESTFTRVQNATGTTGLVQSDEDTDADYTKAFSSATTSGNICIAVGQTYIDPAPLGTQDITKCEIANTGGYSNSIADGDFFTRLWDTEACCAWAIANGGTMSASLDSTVVWHIAAANSQGSLIMVELGA